MFQFEFQKTLFQLDAREPELAALSRLPPKIFNTSLPLLRMANPSAKHCARLCEMHGCDLILAT